jgi:hypothetical protein
LLCIFALLYLVFLARRINLISIHEARLILVASTAFLIGGTIYLERRDARMRLKDAVRLPPVPQLSSKALSWAWVGVVILPILFFAGIWYTRGVALTPRLIGSGIGLYLAARCFFVLLRK